MSISGLVSAFNFGVLKHPNSKLRALQPLLKQVIPRHATIVPLGRWSTDEHKTLCRMEWVNE